MDHEIETIQSNDERDYFEEDWVGLDDDYDHLVQQNKSFSRNSMWSEC